MRREWKVGLLSAAGVSAALAIVFAACLPDPDRPPTGGGPAGAEPCDGGGPGNLPPANCDNTPNACMPPGPDPSCTIAANCGDPKTCLPLADNSKSNTWDLRIRRLFATAPQKLTTLQSIIIDKGINLPGTLNCGEAGDGAFNWLLRIDKTNKTLQTGGAPPSSDPIGVGYCFYQNPNLGGLNVGPSMSKLTFASDTQFSSDPIDKLFVPIFVGGDVNNVVILPISKAVVTNTTISKDGNCIGGFNLAGVGQSLGANKGCADQDPSSCMRWHTDGVIAGYITLEDADKVNVDLLQETLCVLLTGSQKDMNPPHGCLRTGGKINAMGDYCSTTGKAGDCADAFWLTATFAASAVKVNDGAGVVGCGVLPDAGVDSGSDSGADSGSDSGAMDASGD